MNWKQAFNLGLLAPGVWGGESETSVSGVWVFNDGVLSFEDENGNYYFPGGVTSGQVSTKEVHTVSFVSNSEEYSSMSFSAGAQNFMWSMMYDDTTVYTDYEEFDNTQPYRTIDFGTTPQTVTEAFYKWLTANAVKQ